jgi:Fe-S cluster assembly iron-binding protein IscA
LALDELKKTDEVFDCDGVTFLVDKQLYEENKPMTVDYVETRGRKGFMIKSGLDEKNGCGSCSC